ncbi:phosphatase 2C-like domain-containing protein [Trametes maxima]|nr:phosphatase 2C-like domain-containing protein [Trametes maxima]
MKPIHKRFYTVLPRPAAVAPSTASTSQLPRVRSNSASSSRSLYTSTHLSFLDGPSTPPPPPSSRGNSNVIVGTRLAAEVRGEIEGHTNHPSQGQSSSLPYSIALTLGQHETSSHLPLSPYNPFLPYQSLSPLLVYSAKSAEAPAPDHRKKRQRTRYHLDVGAYGIPKRSRGQFVAGRDGHGRFAPGDMHAEPHKEDLGRAVQVGEDAYFVRDNAMGVADGVGGWSRLHRTTNVAEPSASALFARRLMHYCSEEVDAASEQPEQSVDPYSDAEDDIYAELEDSLDELEDGLDVLMILEKAYEKTLRSHVRRADQSAPSSRSRSPSLSDSNPVPVAASASQSQTASTSPLHSNSVSRATEGAPEVVPLFEGSSTALVAILEHPSPRSVRSLGDAALFDPQPGSAKSGPDGKRADGAVIRIAHLGDCVGMLIRGEEIVWRTEEMWWNFNTPVQLGPASSTKPHDARVFTVPVQEDDILILASDGLSDNLWDADILDEVVRFRRSFMNTPSPSLADAAALAPPTPGTTALRRTTLAGMLSEALCSRAKRVSETRRARDSASSSSSPGQARKAGGVQVGVEVPFARRAREQGRLFDGGKPDDISVLVAVISPVE